MYGYNITLVADDNWGEFILQGIRDGRFDVNMESWRLTGKLLSQYASTSMSTGAIGCAPHC